MWPAKRLVWRKLHLAVDTRTGVLVAHALTTSEVHDGTELAGLLARIDAPIAAVCADKASDSFDCQPPSSRRDAQPVTPPRKGAAIRPPTGRPDVPPTRGAAVARIAEVGRAPKAPSTSSTRQAQDVHRPKTQAFRMVRRLRKNHHRPNAIALGYRP